MFFAIKSANRSAGLNQIIKPELLVTFLLCLFSELFKKHLMYTLNHRIRRLFLRLIGFPDKSEEALRLSPSAELLEFILPFRAEAEDGTF